MGEVETGNMLDHWFLGLDGGFTNATLFRLVDVLGEVAAGKDGVVGVIF